MKVYSLDKTKRDKNQDNLYDLIYPLLDKENKINDIREYVVGVEKEMRLDLICYDIYGSLSYMDELMHLNGILDPYAVKPGDIIKWTPLDKIKSYRKDYDDSTKIKEELELDKDNKKPTTSAPDDYVPVMIDKERSEIIITNKLR